MKIKNLNNHENDNLKAKTKNITGKLLKYYTSSDIMKELKDKNIGDDSVSYACIIFKE